MSDPSVEWSADSGTDVETARYVAAGAIVGVVLLAWRALRMRAYDRLLAISVALAVLPITGRALVGTAAIGGPIDGGLRRRPLLVAGGLLAGAVGLWALGSPATRAAGPIP